MGMRIIWESNPELSQDEIFFVREEMDEPRIGMEEGLTDEEIIEYYLSEINPLYLEDERANLDIKLPGKVIAIADLGLWNGRRQGYRIMSDNLNCVLQSHVSGISDICVYGDGYNIRADEAHHDGTNHYLYRVIRPDKCTDDLLNAIYNGDGISKDMLNRYTRSLYPYVAQVYGWPCRQNKRVMK